MGPRAWARSFNSLTCGSFVERLTSGGLLQRSDGQPLLSCGSRPYVTARKPDFSSNGGNATAQYQILAGLGVWGLSPSGNWEDRPGTSYAAPLLAREAAFALQRLQRVCERGAQPFACDCEGVPSLTCKPPVNEGRSQRIGTAHSRKGMRECAETGRTT